MANDDIVIVDGELTPHQALSRFGKKSDADDVLGPDPNAEVIATMNLNRKVNSRTASSARSGGISIATARPRDPMFYWKQNNLPYDYSKEEDLIQMRNWARILYATHPIVGSAIDIMARWPLVGMELVSKDQRLTKFYEELFFDEGGLNYEEYLVDVGTQYWIDGEVFPFGQFNEVLGVWDDDELIDPNIVDVIKSPFLREPRFEMALPETLREILMTGEPQWEYRALMNSYPELKNFLGPESRMPVSNILMRHIRFKGDVFSPRGIPILARAFRTIMQEEMLNAAQDAIADRLYTPMVLVKLGASATDLGTDQPWIPSQGDLAAFEESLDAALAGDFRALVHHFAVQVQTVFGKETIPNMTPDFDRITDRVLQVFGLSKTMLSGASSGQTYAADALNRDLVSQLMQIYQRKIARFFRERALVVAEAQEHWDYEERGGKRYPIMEEIIEYDEETGEPYIVEQPKLLVPEIRFRNSNLKDEATFRTFIEGLRAAGVPISMKTRLINSGVELEEEIELVREEQVNQAIEAQITRQETYIALMERGLPIPDDLEQDFRAKVLQPAQPKAEEQPVPLIGDLEEPTMGLVPPIEDEEGGSEEGGGAEDGNSDFVALPRNKIMSRPPESDEMRESMPKASVMVRRVVASIDDDGEEIESEVWMDIDNIDDEEWVPEGRGRLLSGPSHIGMRRYVGIDKDTPLDDD